MNILVDTHILIWHFAGSDKASPQARLMIDSPENNVFYSVVVPWEIAIKQDAHPESIPVSASSLIKLCSEFGMQPLPIENKHVEFLSQLDYQGAGEHRDPFDRIMLAQAAVEGMLFLTHDKRLKEYGLANVLLV